MASITDPVQRELLSTGDALRLEGVSKRFGALQAVEDVSFSVAAGERRAVIGANGAGKTTLFNVITGIFPASSGQVLLFGKDVTDWKFVEARDVPAGPWTKYGNNNTFVLQRRGANLFLLDRNNAYGASKTVGWKRRADGWQRNGAH
jgi:ABC-type branched-subunit amino acid transport system ATPase component